MESLAKRPPTSLHPLNTVTTGGTGGEWVDLSEAHGHIVGTMMKRVTLFRQRNIIDTLLVSLGLVFLMASCTRHEPGKWIAINDHVLQVEVADTPDRWAQGLMGRESLPRDWGMLFVFPEEALRVFWMKNTSIPLSIAYISSGGVILDIYHMEPYSLQPVQSRKPARFALEVNAGVFEENGISEGDRVQFHGLR